MKNIKPDFYIVGAAKSGTTSLYHYLRQHPQIYLSLFNKEPHFHVKEYFSKINPSSPMASLSVRNFVFDTNKYLELFKEKTINQITGEASTGYLWDYSDAIRSIKNFHGAHKPKIIIILRDPKERSFSAFSQLKFKGYESLSFRNAIEEEEKRIEAKWHPFFYYIKYGMYTKQVKAYLENFEYVSVILFDDFNTNSELVLKNICEFLSIDKSFKFNTAISYNKTGSVKSRFINNLFIDNNKWRKLLRPILRMFTTLESRRKIMEKLRMGNLKKESLNKKDEEFLRGIFEKEIIDLEKIISQNLSRWYK